VPTGPRPQISDRGLSRMRRVRQYNVSTTCAANRRQERCIGLFPSERGVSGFIRRAVLSYLGTCTSTPLYNFGPSRFPRTRRFWWFKLKAPFLAPYFTDSAWHTTTTLGSMLKWSGTRDVDLGLHIFRHRHRHRRRYTGPFCST